MSMMGFEFDGSDYVSELKGNRVIVAKLSVSKEPEVPVAEVIFEDASASVTVKYFEEPKPKEVVYRDFVFKNDARKLKWAGDFALSQMNVA